MIKKIIIAVLAMALQNVLFGQAENPDEPYFRSPLDIPIFLSGNFAELRSTHFHAGIDMKTQTVVGHKLHAAAEGYISRIKIQTGGYGRTIYINHPNGQTTVYAHMLSFSPKIENYIKKYQYKHKTHTLDLYTDKNLFQLKKGQFIGLSGNSGSSGGPHLHFEIRNSGTQNPTNPLLLPFDIKDNLPPTIKGVALYPLEGGLVKGSHNKLILDATGSNGKYSVYESVLPVSGNVGFGIEVYDYLNGSANRCGIYSLEMKIDGKRHYFHEINEFSFTEAGYVKSHVDYTERIHSGRKFQKTFKDPNNNLSFYKLVMDNKGLLFNDNELHTVEFIVHDTYGNRSELGFTVQSDSTLYKSVSPPKKDENSIPFQYHQNNSYTTDSIKILVPRYALFDDLDFRYKNDGDNPTAYSSTHQVHNIFTPLSQSMTLSIRTSIPDRLRSKAVIIYTDEDKEIHAYNSEYDEGWVTTRTNKFGPYYVDVDTVAPVLTPLNIFKGADMSQENSIRIKVTDAYSGVETYNGQIDDSWVLFEYDPKNDLLEYFFDETRLNKGSSHVLELMVTDGKQNIATYQTVFNY